MLRALKFMLPAFLGLVLLACAQEAEEATDEAADTTAMEAGLSIADLAGTWNMATTNTDPADTVVNRYQIVIDEAGTWTLNFPDRDPVTATAVVEGDHINTVATFESVRRPGVMVTTNTVFRLEGGQLVGDVTAHWQTSEADSVGQLRTVGTRAP